MEKHHIQQNIFFHETIHDITSVILLCKLKAHILHFKGKSITRKFRISNTIKQESGGVFEDRHVSISSVLLLKLNEYMYAHFIIH